MAGGHRGSYMVLGKGGVNGKRRIVRGMVVVGEEEEEEEEEEELTLSANISTYTL